MSSLTACLSADFVPPKIEDTPINELPMIMILCAWQIKCVAVISTIQGSIKSDELHSFLIENALNFHKQHKKKIHEGLKLNRSDRCECGRKDDHAMIVCFSDDCDEKFHRKCIRLFKKPKKWFCFNCRKKMVLGFNKDAPLKPCKIVERAYCKQVRMILLAKLGMLMFPDDLETSHLCGIAICCEEDHLVAEPHCANCARIGCMKAGKCINRCYPPCIIPPVEDVLANSRKALII